MLDYIWLDDESPILQQVPVEYSSAAIIFSPFIQMPEGWGNAKRKKPGRRLCLLVAFKHMLSWR